MIKRRSVVTALAAFAVCTLLACAIAPDASRIYWLHTFFDTSRVGVTYISNQSPYGTLARILHGTDEIGSWYTAIPLTIGVFGFSLFQRDGFFAVAGYVLAGFSAFLLYVAADAVIAGVRLLVNWLGGA